MKVVKIDKAATDYYIKLTNLQSEYRRIGVNYNQIVKEFGKQILPYLQRFLLVARKLFGKSAIMFPPSYRLR